MPLKEAIKGPDPQEILVSGIKVDVEKLLNSPQTFQEKGRKSRLIPIDTQALGSFRGLPKNHSQIVNARMQVAVTNEENIVLRLERKGKEVNFTDTEPKATLVCINFQDKNKPHIIFMFYLELKDGQAPRSYIAENNTLVKEIDMGKPTFRPSITYDLQTTQAILQSQLSKNI